MTDRVDFLDPRAGRTGLFAPEVTTFSLLSSGSSAPVLAAGEAGIVLSRFFSARVLGTTFREEVVASGLGRVVVLVAVREVLGVAGTFLAPTGLAALGRVDVVGWRVVRLAGVAATVLEVAVRSALVFEAKDILLGLADIPALPFSSPDGLSSTELTDCLFWWAAVAGFEEVVVLAGFLTVVVVGRAGGLLRELPPFALAAEEVVDGLVEVDSLGVDGFVKGLGVALDDLSFDSSAREEA